MGERRNTLIKNNLKIPKGNHQP